MEMKEQDKQKNVPFCNFLIEVLWRTLTCNGGSVGSSHIADLDLGQF
jgi:hypothetical protein